jgi:hypothetical protein
VCVVHHEGRERIDGGNGGEFIQIDEGAGGKRSTRAERSQQTKRGIVAAAGVAASCSDIDLGCG